MERRLFRLTYKRNDSKPCYPIIMYCTMKEVNDTKNRLNNLLKKKTEGSEQREKALYDVQIIEENMFPDG